jgi:hypothetical protein
MLKKPPRQNKLMDKKRRKNITITQKEHDEWHRKHKGYGAKDGKEHETCHRKMGITVKKPR